ncbi:MAG: phosphate signaling complex protein PhoU [Pontibacterium sp.]
MQFEDNYSSHISQQFNDELEQIRTALLTMGGVVERQVNDAVQALLTGDSDLAEQSRRVDQQTNQMELQIDEQCTTIIARRQPAASDLRLIIAVSKAVSDLERIGDEASRICRHAIDLAKEGDSQRGYQEVRHIGNLVREMVKDVLTAFARNDTELAYRVAKQDKAVDQEYRTAMRLLATYMMEDPRAITGTLNVIWVLRSLERIGDHACNMAEHLIYLVSGTDVRHATLKQIKQAAHQDDEDSSAKS